MGRGGWGKLEMLIYYKYNIMNPGLLRVIFYVLEHLCWQVLSCLVLIRLETYRSLITKREDLEVCFDHQCGVGVGRQRERWPCPGWGRDQPMSDYLTKGGGKALPPAVTLQSVQLTKTNIVPAGLGKNTQVVHLNFCTASNKGWIWSQEAINWNLAQTPSRNQHGKEGSERRKVYSSLLPIFNQCCFLVLVVFHIF